MSGWGVFTYANGNRYEGGFAADQLNGQGTYFFANGDRYVGPWLDGKRDGPGTYTDARGLSENMEFKNGDRVS